MLFNDRLKTGNQSGEIVGKVSFKGFLFGGIVDVVTSFILGIPIAIYAVSRVNLSGIPKDQVAAAIAAGINGNTPVYLAQLLIGAGCSVLGGYVAAWLAKHDELLNSTLSAYLCFVIGIFSITSGKDSHPMIVQALLLAAGPLCSLLGGYLRLRRKTLRLQRA
jgi:hypothetical protein